MPDTANNSGHRWIENYDEFAYPDFKWGNLTTRQQEQVKEALGNVDKYGLWYEVVYLSLDSFKQKGTYPRFDEWVTKLTYERHDWDID